jgi:hypothetical protein
VFTGLLCVDVSRPGLEQGNTRATAEIGPRKDGIMFSKYGLILKYPYVKLDPIPVCDLSCITQNPTIIYGKYLWYIHKD